MTNDKKAGSRKKRLSYVVAALFVFLLMLSLTVANLPAAYADDGEGTGGLLTETPAPAEEPQPSETPAAEEPQPIDTNELSTTEVNGLECVDGEILVKFKDTITDTGIVNALEAVDSSVRQELPMDNLVVTDVPEGDTVESFIETMKDQPDVEYAQPNYVYRIDTTVNDPYATADYQWHLGTIGAYGAWDVMMGSSNIKVAVIDTGMDIDHPDLSGKIYAQYDYVNSDSIAQDDEGHGTHVSGIIAATANNGAGVAGVAPGVKLIAVKVLDSNGEGTTENCIKGIYYAVSHGADVINMSFGSYGGDYLLENAVNYAVNAGVVCVASAGNDSTEDYSIPSDYEQCISVTATDKDDILASFSNFGHSKDISAPGDFIYSTYNPALDPEGYYYCYMSGTSMASPVVAGVAALVLSVNPDLTVDQVKDILYSTAVDLGTEGRDDYYGYGRVNAEAAVNKAKAGTPVITSAVSTSYNSIDLTWNAMDNAAGYEVWRSTSAGGVYTKLASEVTETTYSDSGLTSGTTYYYKVKAFYESESGVVPGYFSAYYAVRPTPLAPASCSASEADYDSIKIEWANVDGASGYMVYRSASENGTYTRIATTTRMYYTNDYVGTGTAYYYKVRAYRSSTGIYGDYSAVATAVTSLKPMESVAAAAYYPTSIKISWKAVPGRTSYEIYRSLTGEEGSFTKYKTMVIYVL